MLLTDIDLPGVAGANPLQIVDENLRTFVKAKTEVIRSLNPVQFKHALNGLTRNDGIHIILPEVAGAFSIQQVIRVGEALNRAVPVIRLTKEFNIPVQDFSAFIDIEDGIHIYLSVLNIFRSSIDPFEIGASQNFKNKKAGSRGCYDSRDEWTIKKERQGIILITKGSFV